MAQAQSAKSALCESQMARAAQHYDVPIAVLYAVALTETGNRGSLQPFAMNVEGRPVYSENLAEAKNKFEGARRRGAKLIDIGCMQVNHHFHGRNFRDLDDMFNPARNVDYAAQFLKVLRKREATWTLAVARYHAGPNNNAAQKRYVCAVMSNMAATGFGAWTASAREFCK